MAELTLEERVTALEAEFNNRIAALEAEISQIKQPSANKHEDVPWWEQRFGAFANSPEYDEAAEAGRKYREALRLDEESREAA